MLKETRMSSTLNCNPGSGSRLSFAKRLNHSTSNSKIPSNKENSSSRVSYSVDYPLASDEELSPSKVYSCNFTKMNIVFFSCNHFYTNVTAQFFIFYLYFP